MENLQVDKVTKSSFELSFLKDIYRKIIEKTKTKIKEEKRITLIDVLLQEYDKALEDLKVAENHFNFASGKENIDIANEQLTICKTRLNLIIRKIKNEAEAV